MYERNAIQGNRVFQEMKLMTKLHTSTDPTDSTSQCQQLVSAVLPPWNQRDACQLSSTRMRDRMPAILNQDVRQALQEGYNTVEARNPSACVVCNQRSQHHRSEPDIITLQHKAAKVS